MYGSLNALFTGLAFAGLLYTIILQKLSLLDNEKEKLKQNFEATFFQLFGSLETMINSLDIRFGRADHRTELRGRDCFIHLFNEFRGYTYLGSDEFKAHDGVDRVKLAYNKFYGIYQTDLGHYYRSMYHVFKFISMSCPDNKVFYAHLVRAQLASQQLLLLFYNGMSVYGEGFKKYIEEFALLKHLPTELISDQTLLAYYSPKAYGKESQKPAQ